VVACCRPAAVTAAVLRLSTPVAQEQTHAMPRKTPGDGDDIVEISREGREGGGSESIVIGRWRRAGRQAGSRCSGSAAGTNGYYGSRGVMGVTGPTRPSRSGLSDE